MHQEHRLILKNVDEPGYTGSLACYRRKGGYRTLKTALHAAPRTLPDGRTLTAASTLDPEVKSKIKTGGDREAAKLVGDLIGKRAVAGGIETAIFDRGGYKYHGRVAALADGAREAGLKF